MKWLTSPIAGLFPPNEPIYTIPPIEAEPEMSIRADLLGESRDWGHGTLKLEEMHAKGHIGAGVVIAICDTGIDPDHADLKSQLLPAGHKDFTGSPYGTRDYQGHGTHCAGIAAAASNTVGLIGAAPAAKLLAVKVLNDYGSGASSWIAAGIKHAADAGADIISLSVGGSQPDTQTRDAIKYAAARGCWIVCAAGNDGGPATSYPGHYPESIAVAAIGKDLLRASFSTINAENDIAAPGVSIMSTLPEGRYGTMSGTSMATPYVAGCLALLRSAIKAAGRVMLTQTDVLTALSRLSNDLVPVGKDANTGYGLINLPKLIAEFGTVGPPVPTLPPQPPGTYTMAGTLNMETGTFVGTIR